VSDVSGLSLDARMSTRLAEIMRPIEQVPAIDSDRPLVEVVLAVQTGKHDRLMVVRDGEILGALTADDILGRVSGSARPADSGAS